MQKENVVEKKKMNGLIKVSVGSILVFLLINIIRGEILGRKISPDKEIEVIVKTAYIPLPPRHFQIKIGKPSWFGKYKTIYVSPDADDQKKERVIWSKDSSKFLIVSRNAVSDIPYGANLITTGENIDFFYDLSSGRILADCYEPPTKVEFFTFDAISNIEFEEPIRPLPSPKEVR
jgi:hypothetical protein